MREKRLPKLDNRLSAIMDMACDVKNIADIGCDHGRLSLLLAKRGMSVIATDISKPSLEKTNDIASLHNAEIDARLGDGLAVIEDGEVQAAVIAGMGQNTIINILDGAKDKITKMHYVILQSMNGDYDLRSYLSDNGYTITDERLVRDRRRLYCIIKAVSNKKHKLSELELYLGPKLIKNGDEHLRLYAEHNISIIKDIIAGMKKASDKDHEKIEKLHEIMSKIEEIANAKG